MKKLLLLVAFFGTITGIYGQDAEKGIITNTEKAVQKIIDTTGNGWKRKGNVIFLFNQSNFNNWLAGGENNMSGNIGLNYESEVILPVFRSASADVTAKFLAKDMHSGERGQIEQAIRKQMTDILEPKGFVIDNVLMKSINLPSGLARTIEEKLQAEQEAQRMEFVKEREKRDAERKIIEAEGKKEIARIQAEGERNASIIQAEGRKSIIEIEALGKANAMKIEATAVKMANDTINKTLTPTILKLRQIEAFRALSNSNNSKLILTDGKTPFLSLPDNF